MEQQGSRFARRDFFSVFVVGMSIARVSVVAARAVAAAEAEEDHLGSRYKESEHIKTYYRVSSYERGHLC
jgi:hypothetical protein